VLRTLSPEFDALYADCGRPSIAPEYILRAILLQVFYSVREGALLSQLCGRLRDGSIIICVLDTTRLIEGSIDETGRRARFSGEGLDSVGFKQKPRLSLHLHGESRGFALRYPAVSFSCRERAGDALGPRIRASRVVDGDLCSRQQTAAWSIDYRALHDNWGLCNGHFLILLGIEDVLL